MAARSETIDLLDELAAADNRAGVSAYAVRLVTVDGLGSEALRLNVSEGRRAVEGMMGSGALFSARILSFLARRPDRMDAAQRQALETFLADEEVRRRLQAIVQAISGQTDPAAVIARLMEHEPTCALLTAVLDSVMTA